MAKQDDWARITLRLPRELHEKLNIALDETNRSMNAEIVARLQATFDVSSKALEYRIAKPVTEVDRLRREITRRHISPERLAVLTERLERIAAEEMGRIIREDILGAPTDTPTPSDD